MDIYSTFEDLKLNEQEGADYRIRWRTGSWRYAGDKTCGEATYPIEQDAHVLMRDACQQLHASELEAALAPIFLQRGHCLILASQGQERIGRGMDEVRRAGLLQGGRA